MITRPTPKPSAKPWIADIHAYVPGKAHTSDGRELVKLSANENPLGSSLSAIAAMAQARKPSDYPDPDSHALRSALGELYDIDPARIVCGTGSGELLGLAAQAYAGPGDEIVYSRYGFSLYEIVTKRCGAMPVVAADNDFGTDIDQLLKLVSDQTRVVFVANPNNPTGSYLPAAEIARLHAGLPSDVLLVLDHAYAEYLTDDEDDGGLALAATHENVLVTRTFSKIYGLAGERIGWATGAPSIIADLNRIRGPFNVTNHGQAAALAAVGDQEFVRSSRDHNAAELARFTDFVEGLGNYGLRPIPSKANFLLILFEGDVSAEMALTALADAGYAARWLPGQDLPQGLRITIGTEAQMDDVMATLRNLVEGA
jgi:histidinol-phosphate aminotransferase